MELDVTAVDTNFIATCGVVTSGGVFCSSCSEIVRRDSYGAVMQEFQKQKTDTNITTTVVVPGQDVRLWVGYESGLVRIYNTQTGRIDAEQLAHCGSVTSMVSHGRRIYTGSNDKCVFEWHADRLEQLRCVTNETGPISTLYAIGMVLFTVDSSPYVRCWNISTSKPAGKLIGHENTIRTLHFHPQPSLLWTGADDGELFLWDVTELQFMAALAGHRGSVCSINLLPNSGFTLTASTKEILLWSPIYQSSPTELYPPACLQQLSIQNICTLLPIKESPSSDPGLGHAELWILRDSDQSVVKITGKCTGEDLRVLETTVPMIRSKTVRKSRKKKRSPNPSKGSDSVSRQVSLVRSHSNSSRAKSPSAVKRSEDLNGSRRDAAHHQRLAKTELQQLADENAMLRRQLHSAESELVKEKRVFTTQLSLAAERESRLTRACQLSSEAGARATFLMKSIVIEKPDMRPKLQEIWKLFTSISKWTARGMRTNNSPIHSSGIPRHTSRSRSPRRLLNTKHALRCNSEGRKAMSDVSPEICGWDSNSLTSADSRMPLKRGAWDKPATKRPHSATSSPRSCSSFNQFVNSHNIKSYLEDTLAHRDSGTDSAKAPDLNNQLSKKSIYENDSPRGLNRYDVESEVREKTFRQVMNGNRDDEIESVTFREAMATNMESPPTDDDITPVEGWVNGSTGYHSPESIVRASPSHDNESSLILNSSDQSPVELRGPSSLLLKSTTSASDTNFADIHPVTSSNDIHYNSSPDEITASGTLVDMLNEYVFILII